MLNNFLGGYRELAMVGSTLMEASLNVYHTVNTSTTVRIPRYLHQYYCTSKIVACRVPVSRHPPVSDGSDAVVEIAFNKFRPERVFSVRTASFGDVDGPF